MTNLDNFALCDFLLNFYIKDCNLDEFPLNGKKEIKSIIPDEIIKGLSVDITRCYKDVYLIDVYYHNNHFGYMEIYTDRTTPVLFKYTSKDKEIYKSVYDIIYIARNLF